MKMTVCKKIEIDREEQKAVNMVISMMTEILNDAELCDVGFADSYADDVRIGLELLQDECFVCYE